MVFSCFSGDFSRRFPPNFPAITFFFSPYIPRFSPIPLFFSVSFFSLFALNMVRDSALPAKKRSRSVKAKPEVISIKSSADSDVVIKSADVKKNKRMKTSQVESKVVGKKVVKDESDNLMQIVLRSSPFSFAHVMTELSEGQKKAMDDFGFGSLVGFNIKTLPGKLVYYVVDAFDPEKMVISTSRGDIPCDRDAVYDVFGIPKGENDILEYPSGEHSSEFVKEWLSQFPENASIRKVMLSDIIIKGRRTDNFFKMNILMLFANTMVTSSTNGQFSKEVLYHVPIDADMCSIDWCGYLLKYLKTSKQNWDRNYPEKNPYSGPATFLALLYVDRTKCDSLNVVRERPIFKNWSNLLSSREKKEVAMGSFGLLDLFDNNKKFSSKEDCYKYLDKKIEDALSIKKVLFDTLKEEMKSYPDDAALTDYYNKTCNIFSFEEAVNKDGIDAEFHVTASADDDDHNRVDLNLDSQKNVEDSTLARVNLGSDEFFPSRIEVDNPQEKDKFDSVETVYQTLPMSVDEGGVVEDVVGHAVGDKNEDMPTFNLGITQTPTPPNKAELLVETNENNESSVDQVFMDVDNNLKSNDNVNDGKGNEIVNDVMIEENSVLEKDSIVEKDPVVEKDNDVEVEIAVVANVSKEQTNVDLLNEASSFEKVKESQQNVVADTEETAKE